MSTTRTCIASFSPKQTANLWRCAAACMPTAAASPWRGLLPLRRRCCRRCCCCRCAAPAAAPAAPGQCTPAERPCTGASAGRLRALFLPLVILLLFRTGALASASRPAWVQWPAGKPRAACLRVRQRAVLRIRRAHGPRNGRSHGAQVGTAALFVGGTYCFGRRVPWWWGITALNASIGQKADPGQSWLLWPCPNCCMTPPPLSAALPHSSASASWTR